MKDNQAEFYDSLVGREYTTKALMDLHGLSRPTVSKWLKDAGIDAIPGSWPPRFKLEKGVPRPNPSTPAMPGTPAYRQDPDKARAFLNHLLDKETELDVAKMFRKAQSLQDMQLIIKGLEDTLHVAHFYTEIFQEEGLV